MRTDGRKRGTKFRTDLGFHDRSSCIMLPFERGLEINIYLERDFEFLKKFYCCFCYRKTIGIYQNVNVGGRFMFSVLGEF